MSEPGLDGVDAPAFRVAVGPATVAGLLSVPEAGVRAVSPAEGADVGATARHHTSTAMTQKAAAIAIARPLTASSGSARNGNCAASQRRGWGNASSHQTLVFAELT